MFICYLGSSAFYQTVGDVFNSGIEITHGSQQDYLVGKSGSAQIYVVVIWPRFKQNNMTNTTFENDSQMLW